MAKKQACIGMIRYRNKENDTAVLSGCTALSSSYPPLVPMIIIRTMHPSKKVALILLNAVSFLR
ncbi:hypothetical protein D3C75_1068800 [compost metagenome]